MRLSTEGAETLQNLGRVLLLEQVDGQEAVVGGHVEGRHLAGFEEVADVLHLDEGHCAGLELDRSMLWLDGQIRQFAERNTVFQRIKQVAVW